ncbi:hypothetical protein LCGC14_1976770 [marine sediment metagenome]|uniref:Uncharacterized protein n=1 Tax=marine sediment metagenome TaxID=412755 RepID=A0A0F9I751_9ZZZZ
MTNDATATQEHLGIKGIPPEPIPETEAFRLIENLTYSMDAKPTNGNIAREMNRLGHPPPIRRHKGGKPAGGEWQGRTYSPYMVGRLWNLHRGGSSHPKDLIAIIDDAATDHSGDNRTALAWLTVDFTTSQDSDSVNWDTNVSLRFKRGSTYRRIVEQFTTLGYEFDMRPDPADDTDLRLEAYNPAALGTDRTTGDGGAIIDGFIAAGPLIRREPAATYVMVEGESLQWADTRNTVLETPWGEIEEYVGSKDQLVTGLATQAAAELAAIDQQELRFTLQNPTLTPGVDYRIGDIVRVTPGVIATAKYRVMGITVKGDEPEPKYQLSCEAQ